MYDKPENAQLSRRERVLLDPLEASKKSLGPIKGIRPNILKQLKRGEFLKKAEREICFMEKHKITATNINEQSYPFKLKHCPDAPLVLFQKSILRMLILYW